MEDLAAVPPGALYESLPALRRARRIGLLAVLVAVGVSFLEHPAPATSGQGLAVAVADGVLLVSGVTLVVRADPPVTLAALTAMIAAAAVARLAPAVAVRAKLGCSSRSRSPASGSPSARRSVPGCSPPARRPRPPARTAFDRPARRHRTGYRGLSPGGSVRAQRRGGGRADPAPPGRAPASRNSEAEAAMLRERSRLARDMHDVLAHSLSGLMLQLEGARMLAAQPSGDGQLSPTLDRAHHLARTGLDEARRAISALRDEDLPGPDAAPAAGRRLRAGLHHPHLPDRQRDRAPPGHRDLAHHLPGRAGGAHQHPQARASRARRASPPLRRRRHPPHGPGPRAHARRAHDAPAAVVGGGYGLTGMRERAALLGGAVEAGRTDDGFQVELWIPA